MRRKQAHKSSTPAIEAQVFECGKPEHVAQFAKAKKAIVNYIRMSGDKESALVASSLETMTAAAIPIPPRPQ